jgi:hypothetical protein
MNYGIIFSEKVFNGIKFFNRFTMTESDILKKYSKG